MSFGEKIKVAFKKIKKRLIVYLVIVLFGAIMVVSPFAVSIEEAEMAAQVGEDKSYVLLTQLFKNIQHPLGSMSQCFKMYFFAYLECLKYYFLIMVFFIIIGISKAIPKHEFQDIENGSSDWSENGEQYKVLNRKKGIILAEKNYLPVDKRGNVNVLVVRRFWCW